MSKQLEDMQASQQSISAQQTQQQQQAAAPPPDVLYNNALRDYQAGKNDLAAQEFADYVKYYPNTDLAGNSNFYLADIQFRQGNYQAAAKSYDVVLQSFPDGTKAASAELKKGLALIELGQQEDGIAALRHVIQRYPKSNEALQARERLRKLGVASRRDPRPGAVSKPQTRATQTATGDYAPLWDGDDAGGDACGECADGLGLLWASWRWCGGPAFACSREEPWPQPGTVNIINAIYPRNRRFISTPWCSALGGCCASPSHGLFCPISLTRSTGLTLVHRRFAIRLRVANW